MMTMTNAIASSVETRIRDGGCYLEEEFIELIYMNPSIILCLSINIVDSSHSSVCSPLT